MRIRKFFVLAAATLIIGAPVVGSSDAAAQSGSRLCGFKTIATEPPIPGLAIAIVYEARKARWAYTKECDTAIDKIRKKRPTSISHTLADGRTIIVRLTWEKVRKATCESVGQSFQGEGIGSDICDHMKALEAYKVIKAPGQAATFEKQ